MHTTEQLGATMKRVFDQEQRNREISIARLEKRIAELELMKEVQKAWRERLAQDYPMLAQQNGVVA